MRNKMPVKKIFPVLGVVSLLILGGCGGGAPYRVNNQSPPDPPAAISVSISPTTALVQPGASQRFTATVQNDPQKKGVTWGFGGCPGACGTIDSTGKYTAPATITPQSIVYITATSVADPTKRATSQVTLVPAPTGLAVSPPVVTIQNNGVQQFTATGGPFGAVPVVNWGVSGTDCTGPSCGTIDSTGIYTAPATAPNPPTVTVTATLAADPSKGASARVILGDNSNNAKLNGQYAFLVNGYDGDGNMAIAGTFKADGKGNIVEGVGDFNFISSGFLATGRKFTGTYSVGADDRGSMTLDDNQVSTGFSQTFAFALGSFTNAIASKGSLIELDGTDIWCSGVFAKQDPAAFSAAAISGGYAFGFSGTSSTGFALDAAGRFTADGGSLSAGQTDVYGSGMPTAALGLPFAGTYGVDASGRGTAAFTFSGQDPGFSNFSFYVISANELLFIEVDTCAAGIMCTFKGEISGNALKQSGGPFAASSLNGAAVFNVTGVSVAVGRETFDGGGNLVGTRDENNGGVISSNTAFNGTYGLDSDGLGRGVIALAGDRQPRVFYLVGPGKGFIIDSGNFDPGKSEAGMFEPQTGEPFDAASLSGNYVLETLPWTVNWSIGPASGVLTADGTGTLTGISDAKDGKGGGLGPSFTGRYSLDAEGRATVAISPNLGAPSNWVLHLISPTKAVAIQVDPGAGSNGVQVLEK
jgi:hypothetical protein